MVLLPPLPYRHPGSFFLYALPSLFVLCLDSLFFFFFLAASVFLFKFSRVRVEVLDCVKACGGPGKWKEGVAAAVAMVIMIIIVAELPV